MAFSADGVQQTPDVLNETYKNNGVFTNDLINFWAIPNVFPQIRAEEYEDYYDAPAPVEKFYQWLDRGLPVIVLVDFDQNPSTGVDSHFVLLHGYDDDTKELMCVDPWTGEEYFFSAKYGDPVKFIYGHRFYSWEVTHEPTSEEKIAQLERTLKDRDDQIAQLSQEVGYYTGELKKQEADNKALIDEVITERNKRLEADRQKAAAEKALETEQKAKAELQERLDSQVEEIAALREALAVSVSVKIKEYPLFKLLKMYFSKEKGVES